MSEITAFSFERGEAFTPGNLRRDGDALTVQIFTISRKGDKDEQEMQPHEINEVALGGRAKAVRDALKRLGMRRCSLALVYRQCRPPEALRLDWYSVFLRWFTALWLAHRAGAEFLLDDLLLRVARLREADAEAQDVDWRGQMVRCEQEHSDVVKAALVCDLRQIRTEAVQCIAAKRQLIAMIDAELGETAAARAA